MPLQAIDVFSAARDQGLQVDEVRAELLSLGIPAKRAEELLRKEGYTPAESPIYKREIMLAQRGWTNTR